MIPRRFLLLAALPLASAVAAQAVPNGTVIPSDPALVSTFGGDGKLEIYFDAGGGNTDTLVKLLRTPDGKYLAVGYATATGGSGSVIAMAKFDASSALDAGFGTGGKVKKDACVAVVNDALIDPLGRIVVVGDTTNACGSGTASYVGVVRFNADGSDDTSFAGDGGMGFSWNGEAGQPSTGVAVSLDGANGDLIVLGNARTAQYGLYSPYFGKVSATGVLGTLAFHNSSAFVDVLARANVPLADPAKSLWLIDWGTVATSQDSLGEFARRSNATLASDATYSGVGRGSVDLPTACPLANGTPVRPWAGVATADRYVMFSGATDAGGIHRSYWGSTDLAGDFNTRRSGCLNAGSQPSVEVRDAKLASAERIDLAVNVYAIGSPGQGMALWRAVPDRSAGQPDWKSDPVFMGYPVEVQFAAATGQTPSAEARSLLLDGGRILIGGSRRWNGADTDFAIGMFFQDRIFANGFD